MAWTYHDYETYSGSARLSRLRLHITEVSAECGPNSSRADASRDNGHLVEYLKDLRERLAELEGDTETSIEATSPRARSGFTRGRPI